MLSRVKIERKNKHAVEHNLRTVQKCASYNDAVLSRKIKVKVNGYTFAGIYNET